MRWSGTWSSRTAASPKRSWSVDEESARIHMVVRWAGWQHAQLSVRKQREGLHRYTTDRQVVETARGTRGHSRYPPRAGYGLGGPAFVRDPAAIGRAGAARFAATSSGCHLERR